MVQSAFFKGEILSTIHDDPLLFKSILPSGSSVLSGPRESLEGRTVCQLRPDMSYSCFEERKCGVMDYLVFRGLKPLWLKSHFLTHLLQAILCADQILAAKLRLQVILSLVLSG